MKRVILNESHIRQIVKETLENLILGEDNIENITPEMVEDIINNSELDSIDSFEYDGQNSGTIDLIYKNNKYDFVNILISFDIDINLGNYDSGDYWTAPYQEESTINDISFNEIYYNIGDNYEGYLDKCPEVVSEEVYDYISNNFEKYLDYDYWNDIKGPDPDNYYDSYRNGDFD